MAAFIISFYFWWPFKLVEKNAGLLSYSGLYSMFTPSMSFWEAEKHNNSFWYSSTKYLQKELLGYLCMKNRGFVYILMTTHSGAIPGMKPLSIIRDHVSIWLREPVKRTAEDAFEAGSNLGSDINILKTLSQNSSRDQCYNLSSVHLQASVGPGSFLFSWLISPEVPWLVYRLGLYL